MHSVSSFFKVEKDVFYKLGVETGAKTGAEQKSHAVVENLIEKLGFTDEKAAEIAEVSIDYVKEVRASLDEKK